VRIAYLINQYPKVSHTFIRREILALERQGFEVQRISLRGWDECCPDEEDRLEQTKTQYVLRNGLKGLLLPTLRAFFGAPAKFLAGAYLAYKMGRKSDRTLLYHLFYFAEACQILSWVRTFGATRIHAHFGTNSADVVMFVGALGGPPYSFTVHGPEEFLKPMGLEEKVQRSNFVVTISSFGRSQMYLLSRHADWHKINVVHCGLERAFYETAPTHAEPAPRFVCVGRLCEWKGQLLLIEAVMRLTQVQIPVELVLVGDGPMRPEIEKLIENYALNDRVRITGWISSNEVRNEIIAARALILPSFAEGLPVAIMEAMALRRPVLTTYIAGIPELVRHRQNGWLFAAGSIDELTDAMAECLQAPIEELQRMGDAGYHRVIKRHASDTEAGKLAALFLAPLEKGPGGHLKIPHPWAVQNPSPDGNGTRDDYAVWRALARCSADSLDAPHACCSRTWRGYARAK
jgi:glycosyltransferase involved in cell wall biosynthesis